MNKKNLKIYAALVLLIGVIGLSLIQIRSAGETTQTELALFNVIQLIFSFGFSWIVSSHYSELSFLDSQKKFAIGAFRRIKEIERSISRAQQLLAQEAKIIDGKSRGDHLPIMMSLLSAQDAVNSSIADWGDIIGDEIHITREIGRLKELRKSSDKFEKEYLDNLRISSKDSTKIDREIDQLKADLPTSLRIEEDTELDYELAREYLDEEISSSGKILLHGLWDGDDSFTGDLSNISPGDTLYLARGFTKNRPNVLLVYDKNDCWVGVITNKLLEYQDKNLYFPYDSFLDVFEDFLGCVLTPKVFGGAPVPITITKIEEINENEYQHFTAVLNIKDIPKEIDSI